MSYETLAIEISDLICTITLNRPKSLNALNQHLIQDLHNALSELKSNDSVNVIILTGSGKKAFVAGADIKEFKDFDSKEGTELARKGQEKLFDFVENFPKPIIAAVNGFALGGGLELALACHFRIASENAKMGLPEVTLGLIPGYGGTQRLPKLIGKGHAAQAIFTAEMISADRALQIGLVNDVTSQEELLDACKKIAKKITRNAPNAIEKAIKCINDSDTDYGFKTEIEQFGSLFNSENFKEGVSAFLEKRKPNFS